MAVDHYFTAQPASPDERRTVVVHLAGRELTLQTAGGVFSPDHVDHATRVLLDEAPPPPSRGDLLDLGCGWGPMTLELALRSPGARVWAVDVNERALDLVRHNAIAVGAANVSAVQPDDVPDDVRFAAIWSNPPIRVGKQALHELLLRWLPRLAPGGSAFLVVGKNLGADSLHRWLADELAGRAEVTRRASAKGFRVLEITAADAAA
ncbi:class I SAM-dependent methyltransferase [Cellulomonas palmilytica]|uniref:class I SAM-dependent methyltransferase n=1 Tax=Cellulomonas palmilytica TaxID=2608402 RepID=UPI001F27DEB7|nr:methyltransferase [Cellulomonas palmilytica]UJP38743.1 methyltransferase [Cellulomonas palmilytica]